MESKDIQKISLGDMPFYWRIAKTPNEESLIPKILPYTFTLNKSINLIIEEQSPEFLKTLRIMYEQESNIGFLLDGHTLAESYGKDFLEFLYDQIRKYKIKKIHEIGCGGCYILDKLKSLGHQVTGIDPSPIAISKAKEKNIQLIPDFYPSDLLKEKADLIFHVDVLEHISNPVEFIASHKEGLTDDGFIIANVPDTTQSIELGDISIASHQHVNSFDERSLFNTFTEAGFHPIAIQKAKIGGSLYGLASKKKIVSFTPKVNENTALKFFQKANLAINKFQLIVEKSIRESKSLGFYMPLRSFPYLAVSGLLDKVRLFDDIEHWHNGYIDGSNTPIENFRDLINNPVDHLFIMSLSYGDLLKEKVRKHLPNIQITVLREILE